MAEAHAVQWSCSQLSQGRCSWVLQALSKPYKKQRCLETLQCEVFGVTKERCERVCALSAFPAPCTRLSGKFYLLAAGSALNFVGTAAALVLLLDVGVSR